MVSSGGSQGPVETLEAKVARLYGQYRQAEVHRKALVFQKCYLQCQVDAFYQTQQAALMMMADMGAPVDFGSKPLHSKYPRPYARFRAVGCVVIATLRFQFVRRKKLHYLRSKVGKLATSTPRLMGVGAEDGPRLSMPSLDSQPCIGLSAGIRTVLSAPPRRSTEFHSSLRQPHVPTTSSATLLRDSSPASSATYIPIPPAVAAAAVGQTLTSTRATHGAPRQSKAPSMKQKHKKQKTTSASKPVLSPATSTALGTPGPGPKVAAGSLTQGREVGDDPQLVAYIQGLERLQARLSKTKL